MMTRAFEKFVPKQFLQRIARDGLENLKPGNVQASAITTLFSDLRSFTTISEGLTPQALFAFLNEYLAQMQGPIDHFGGFIDKFIGDAIMALFDQGKLVFQGTPDTLAAAGGPSDVGDSPIERGYSALLGHEPGRGSW